MEVLLNLVQLLPVALCPHRRHLGPYPLSLRSGLLIFDLRNLILFWLEVLLFPVAQLGKIRLVGSILVNDACDRVLLNLHLVFMADDDIRDSDLRWRILRYGNAT